MYTNTKNELQAKLNLYTGNIKVEKNKISNEGLFPIVSNKTPDISEALRYKIIREYYQ
jgi:hypothetical protein